MAQQLATLQQECLRYQLRHDHHDEPSLHNTFAVHQIQYEPIFRVLASGGGHIFSISTIRNAA